MKNKITFVFFSVAILFGLVIAKAFYVQIINSEKLMAYHNSQVVREVKIYPKRGHILDRTGNPLAINMYKYNIFTFPKGSADIKNKINKINKVVKDINSEDIIQKSKNRKGKFTWIARQIDLEENQVKELRKIEGIVVESQSSRMYPNHELAAQVLGFVGIDNDGLSGAEYYFNENLKGVAQISKYYKDAKGRKIKHKSTYFESKSEDIQLSIDKDIQASLETYLKEGVEKHRALSGGAAVMDAQTGEIWAMANYPTFDPNDIKGAPQKVRKLSFVTDPIEPGSVFKTLTVASALEHKVVKPDTNYFCERGKFRVGNHYISESDNKHAYEWLSVEDILKFSSNIGTTKIAFDLTYPNLKKTLEKFRIGEKTGIEIPGESRGILDKKENIEPLRLSNISFGQGVATTGIQILASYAAVANGGYYVKPTILKVKNSKDVKSKRIISKNTSRQLQQMLIKAVEDGTGSNAEVKHFTIAGKTSTAQRVDSKGGYSGYVAGFVGFPINVNRKFVVFVYVDNPKKGYYGNTVAAPVFQKIVKNILYKRKEFKQLANVDQSKTKNIDFVKTRLASTRRIKKGEMPNLIGLDKRSVFKILEKNNIKFSHRGFGVVKKQYPLPGTPINSTTVVKIHFKAPSYE